MLLVYAIDENCVPVKNNWTDAGLDLKAAKEVVIGIGESQQVPCGIKIEIPWGYVGLIFPRSGLATKKRITLTNTVGIIDSDYRGEIICVMKNEGSFQYTINQYDRIAQLVLVPCMIGDSIITVDESQLSQTNRGEGGFGHTGE